MKNHLFLYCTFVSETFENLNLMVKINQLQMKTAHHKLAFILCVCVHACVKLKDHFFVVRPVCSHVGTMII